MKNLSSTGSADAAEALDCALETTNPWFASQITNVRRIRMVEDIQMLAEDIARNVKDLPQLTLDLGGIMVAVAREVLRWRP